MCTATLTGCTPAVTQLQARASEPRAFGYHVGDLIVRDVELDIPSPLKLDPESLPRSGVHGKALELLRLDTRPALFGARTQLALHYQVMLSPPEVRTLEMPAFRLRFSGGERVQELRIEAWPVTVSPLVPVEVSARQGLGDLRPDALPPLADEASPRQRLMFDGAAAVLALLVLAHAYFGIPWLASQQRPFAKAWRALRSLPASPSSEQAQAALARLHEALNQSAGQVLFESGIGGFVQREPRFAPLAGELRQFFERSRSVFFTGAAATPSPLDGRWLQALARRLQQAERGSA